MPDASRVCTVCEQVLPLTSFYRNRDSIGGHLRSCKACCAVKYGKGRADRARRDRQYFQQIKVERGCTDCGYNANPVALDFDHLPGSVKKYRVCTMAGMRRELIDAEIAKCEVVCANCHRIRTNDRLTAENLEIPA